MTKRGQHTRINGDPTVQWQVAEYFAKSTLQGLLYVSGRGSNPVTVTVPATWEHNHGGLVEEGDL